MCCRFLFLLELCIQLSSLLILRFYFVFLYGEDEYIKSKVSGLYTAQLRCAEPHTPCAENNQQLHNFVVQSHRELLILDCNSNRVQEITLDCNSNRAAQLRCAELQWTVNSRLRKQCTTSLCRVTMNC